MLASYNGKIDIVRFLCDRGASVGVRNKAGWTALLSGCSGGHLGVVEVLVARGADVKVVDGGGVGVLERARKGGSGGRGEGRGGGDKGRAELVR